MCELTSTLEGEVKINWRDDKNSTSKDYSIISFQREKTYNDNNIGQQMSFSVPWSAPKTIFQTHTIIRATLVHEKNQTQLVLCEILFKRVCSTCLTTAQHFLSICKRETLFSDIQGSSGLLIRDVCFLWDPTF